MIIDANGYTRIANESDFQDVQITFTPTEWQELLEFFQLRKKFNPSVFHKSTKTIYQKLLENQPKLKAWLNKAEIEKKIRR
jgi:type IV secretory pathway component VirB8